VLFEPFRPVDTVLFLVYCICVHKINIHSFRISSYGSNYLTIIPKLRPASSNLLNILRLSYIGGLLVFVN